MRGLLSEAIPGRPAITMEAKSDMAPLAQKTLPDHKRLSTALGLRDSGARCSGHRHEESSSVGGAWAAGAARGGGQCRQAPGSARRVDTWLVAGDDGAHE